MSLLHKNSFLTKRPMYFSTPGFGHSLLPTLALSSGIGTLATGEMSRIKMAFDFCPTKNICQRPPLETITCRGGRSGFLVRWVRGWWLWKYYAGLKKKKSFKVIQLLESPCSLVLPTRGERIIRYSNSIRIVETE